MTISVTKREMPKFNLVLNILQYIFDPLEQKLNRKKVDIIRRNYVNSKNVGQGVGFIYKGTKYSLGDQYHLVNPIELHEKFHEEMDQWIEEMKQFKIDLKQVKDYVILIVNKSNDIKDYYELMPERLHTYITKYKDDFPKSGLKLSNCTLQNIKEEQQDRIQLIKHHLMMQLLES